MSKARKKLLNDLIIQSEKEAEMYIKNIGEYQGCLDYCLDFIANCKEELEKVDK